MKFTEITTPFEKKKMIVYGSERNKLVRHNISVRQVEGGVYMGEVEYPSTCNYPRCDLYFYLPAIGLGIMIGGAAADDDVQRYVAAAKSHGMGSAEDFISYLGGCVERAEYIPTDMVELAGCIRPDSTERYMISNAEILRLRREKEAAEKAARAAANAAYVAQKNQEAEEQIAAAEAVLRNGGRLENSTVAFYRSRYDYSSYSIVNHLMRKHGVAVPLRTQGWINDKLKAVTVGDDGAISVNYRKAKGAKCSEKVFDCLFDLVRAVKEAENRENVA